MPLATMLTSTLTAPTLVMPAVLDIEASGFGTGSYPIEVGYVLPDGRAWCSLVRPEPDWKHWDPSAASVHGISREQLLRHGRSAGEIAEHLNAELRDATIYSDSWGHDFTWLNRLYDAADRTPTFKLEAMRALFNDGQAERWHEVKRRVARDIGLQRHRASTDARILQQTCAALLGPNPSL